MTIVTKPLSGEKKPPVSEEPLVDNIANEKVTVEQTDTEACVAPSPYYLQLRRRATRLSTATTMCLLLTALLFTSIIFIGGGYMYRQFTRPKSHSFRGWCQIPYQSMYDDQQNLFGTSPFYHSERLFGEKMSSPEEKSFFKEEFEIDIDFEAYEKIDVPDFHGGRRGKFVHDFSMNKTGIVDKLGQRCFVMPLNRDLVLPPRSLYDLINKMYSGYYDVDTDVVRETMRVVTPPITDTKYVGSYITQECMDFPIYRLEEQTRPIYKRSIEAGPEKFTEFAGKKIIQIELVNMNDVLDYEGKKQTPHLNVIPSGSDAGVHYWKGMGRGHRMGHRHMEGGHMMDWDAMKDMMEDHEELGEIQEHRMMH